MQLYVNTPDGGQRTLHLSHVCVLVKCWSWRLQTETMGVYIDTVKSVYSVNKIFVGTLRVFSCESKYKTAGSGQSVS